MKGGNKQKQWLFAGKDTWGCLVCVLSRCSGHFDLTRHHVLVTSSSFPSQKTRYFGGGNKRERETVLTTPHPAQRENNCLVPFLLLPVFERLGILVLHGWGVLAGHNYIIIPDTVGALLAEEGGWGWGGCSSRSQSSALLPAKAIMPLERNFLAEPLLLN